MQPEILIERIKSLPPEKIAVVEDFVEFLWHRSTKQELPNNKGDRAAELQAIAESMKANTFTGDPPRISREELHERR
ncbi:MAG: DUF2281 domain-containing protein [Acidobacteria bacterium]|nr:DUF2281 domain-containing protein [Acidobacteriota bacterium]